MVEKKPHPNPPLLGEGTDSSLTKSRLLPQAGGGWEGVSSPQPHEISKSLNRYLLLLFALSLFSISPLLAPGYFYSAHDGRHTVFYLMMFDASIQDGALWPRWAMHHIQGYGYPTFIIQAPLGFYIAELFVLLGAGYTLAVKFAWALGFLVSGWGMYRLVVHWLSQRGQGEEADESDTNIHLAALVAGLLYIYIPYHLVDIYVRAALNDTLLLAWFPWLFLAFDKLIVQGAAMGWQRRLTVAILCLAGTLLTHTFALISFTPLLITFVLFRLLWTMAKGRAFFIGRTLLAACAGIGALLLCANFILPLLVEGAHLEQQVYLTDTYDFRRHFVYFGQFFNPTWGFGYSDDPTGVNDGMSFQVGVMALFLSMIALFIAKNVTKQRVLLIYLLFISAAILFTMTPLATPLWETLTPLAIIQFPWRLLALSAFTLSALSGLVLWNLLTRLDMQGDANGGLLLMGLLIIFGAYFTIGAELQPIEPQREDGRAVFHFEQEHPDMIAYTEWVKEPFTSSPMTSDYASESYVEDYSDNGSLNRLAIIAGSGEILSQYSRGSSGGGVVRIDKGDEQAGGQATVRIHLYYFPGWQLRLNGIVIPHRVSDPHGLIEVDLPIGEHHIDVEMGATPIRRLGTAISWTMLLLTVGLWLWPLNNLAIPALAKRKSSQG